MNIFKRWFVSRSELEKELAELKDALRDVTYASSIFRDRRQSMLITPVQITASDAIGAILDHLDMDLSVRVVQKRVELVPVDKP